MRLCTVYKLETCIDTFIISAVRQHESKKYRTTVVREAAHVVNNAVQPRRVLLTIRASLRHYNKKADLTARL